MPQKSSASTKLGTWQTRILVSRTMSLPFRPVNTCCHAGFINIAPSNFQTFSSEHVTMCSCLGFSAQYSFSDQFWGPKFTLGGKGFKALLTTVGGDSTLLSRASPALAHSPRTLAMSWTVRCVARYSAMFVFAGSTASSKRPNHAGMHRGSYLLNVRSAYGVTGAASTSWRSVIPPDWSDCLTASSRGVSATPSSMSTMPRLLPSSRNALMTPMLPTWKAVCNG
mmetsp:Transcript_5293/g.15777  ORF Transcript_5293/g.15777 Transcript_5293/m.15777 type:complete len:224 (+) Transcript_5293:1401-2072(+)